MTFRLVATVLVFAWTAPAIAGTENVAFPVKYKDDHVRYTTVDKSHPKRGHSVRVMYADKAAVAALKAGRKLPSGTVLTMEVYRAKVDTAKKPVKDANGRFVIDKLFGVFVMEKRDGWGGEYPASLRNGNWEYARFHPDGTRHKNRSMKSCFGCHKRKTKDDFVFTLKQLRAQAAK